MRAKPKIYISAKANTVKAYGKPEDKTAHLLRVLHKEGTPTVIYPLVIDTFNQELTLICLVSSV